MIESITHKKVGIQYYTASIVVHKIAAVLAFAAALLIAAAGQAHADDSELDDTEQAICIADDLGQTPAEIAAGINAGDPRINLPNARAKTWFLIATGGCD